MTSRHSQFSSAALFACALLAGPTLARAQAPPVATPLAQPPAADPDLAEIPAEPDFTLAALPTTLRMPGGKFAFRLTHRFSRPIASGTAGDFFADFMGLDSSAKIGFELRYGLRPGTQVTVHRTNDRAIQFLGQHEFLAQSDVQPVTVHAIAAIQGQDNFSETFSTTVGAALSRRVGERGAFYAEPFMVFNANPPSTNPVDPPGTNRHTFMLGLGGRWRLGASSTYVVAEAVPRLAGYDAGVDHVSVGVEHRAGGHVFQFNVSNSFATTLAQIARGGNTNDDWYIGFNLSRRFF